MGRGSILAAHASLTSMASFLAGELRQEWKIAKIFLVAGALPTVLNVQPCVW